MAETKSCAMCAEPIEAAAKVCPKCNSPQTKVCANCGTEVPVKAVLCKNCRAQLPGPGAPSMAPAGAAAPPGDPWAVTDEGKLWGLLAHLLTIVTCFVGPLIVYFIKKDESKFIAHHALQALIFVAAVFVVNMVLMIPGLVFLWMGVGILWHLMAMLVGLAAAAAAVWMGIRAHKGEWAKYPVLDKIIKVKTTPQEAGTVAPPPPPPAA